MSTRTISRIVACMLPASLLWSISFAQDHADPGTSEFAGAERCLVCHNNMGDQHSVHLAELEKIRDQKSDEYLEIQRRRFSLVGQVEHIQHMIDEEQKIQGSPCGSGKCDR